MPPLPEQLASFMAFMTAPDHADLRKLSGLGNAFSTEQILRGERAERRRPSGENLATQVMLRAMSACEVSMATLVQLMDAAVGPSRKIPRRRCVARAPRRALAAPSAVRIAHGPKDAYRHTLASATVAFTSARWVDWVTVVMEGDGHGDVARAMDVRNNRIGARIGAEAESWNEMNAAVLQAVQAGGVAVEDEDRITWLPRERWRDRWY